MMVRFLHAQGYVRLPPLETPWAPWSYHTRKVSDCRPFLIMHREEVSQCMVATSTSTPATSTATLLAS